MKSLKLLRDNFSSMTCKFILILLFFCLKQEEASNILNDTLQSIKLSDRGVYVQASTLGSLEALLEFLRTSKIPVSYSLQCRPRLV